MGSGQPERDRVEAERAEGARMKARRDAWPANPFAGQPVAPPASSGARGVAAPGGLPAGAPAFDAPPHNGIPAPSAPSNERPPWEEDEPAYSGWEWEPAFRESMPGSGLNDLSGSGKFPAVMPLTPGEPAWGRGVSAPRHPLGWQSAANGAQAIDLPAHVEVDTQPSARMRALQPGNLARAAAIVTAAILISRVLGLLRTSLFAAAFGPGRDADAFTQAFVLPDTIFNIVAGGALASAFIPVFTDYLVTKRDRKTAWHVTSAAFNLTTLMLIGVAAVCIVFASPILRLTVPGLFVAKGSVAPEGPEVVTLTQVMLLQPIFLGAATLGVAVLQARQRFMLPAIGQVIYTVGLIAGILATLADRRWQVFGGHLGIMGPTWGVVAGAVLQFVVQLPGLVAAKMQYRLTLDLFHPGVLQIFRLMGPRIVNSAMNYVSIFITRNFLALLSVGVTFGYLTAFTLMQLPLGIFGMAISQAAFPTLAALVADDQWERLRATVLTTLRGMIYLAVPSSLGMAVLAHPLVHLLLAHGRFHPTATDINFVAIPLIYFSFGLVGLAMDEILVRCFYALHDSRTPVYVNLVNLVFVLAMSVILLDPMGSGGLALAFALGALGEAPVLLLLLRNRLNGFDLRGLGIFTLNVLAASLITALAALFVYTLGEVVLPPSDSGAIETVYLLIRLGAAIGAAGVTYFMLSRFLGIDDAVPLDRLVRRVLRRG